MRSVDRNTGVNPRKRATWTLWRRNFRRGVLIGYPWRVIVIALVMFTVGPSTMAAAKPRLSVLYGATGPRLQASGTVTEAPRGARAVLETRVGGRVRARIRGPLGRAGRVKLSWRYPASLHSVTVRVRVISRAKRPRLVALGGWRTIRLTGARRARAVADISASQVQSAPTAGEPGPLELKSTQTVRVGEVLGLGVGDATPDGLLARVTGVSTSNGRTIAQTVPATLPEVLPSGALDVQLVDLPVRASAEPTRQTFGRALSCEGGAQMQAGGAATVSADVTLQAGWSFPFKMTARFEGAVKAKAELSAAVSGAASCTLGSTAMLPQPIRLGAYTFTIGPVPVVLVPKVQLYLSADASVQAAINTNAVATVGANAGVQYDGRTFSPIGGLHRSFSFQPPTLTASGNAQATLTPTLDVLVNGIGGPRVDLNAGLKLSADITKAPWWKLTAPIDLGAQLRLDAWKVHLASPRLSVFSTEPQLAAAQTQAPPAPPAPPPPPPPPPPAPPTGPLERTQLSWDNESDVDLHIWDEQGNHTYFVEQDAIPGARLVEDIIPGFGPEHFIEDENVGRRYTIGVCVYNGSDVTATIDVTDPGGAVRTITRYLPYDKSAALVATTPDGGGYIPEPGWCGDDDPTSIG